MLKLKLKDFNVFQLTREKFDSLRGKIFDYKKYTKFFAIFLVLIVVGLALPRSSAHAIDLVGLVMTFFYSVMYAVFMILFSVSYLLTWIGAFILNMSLNPAIMNQVFANPGIYQGWTIIRDICNLLFLLLMLLVAFGTIVQSNKYNIKNSLTKLILAIFLINFSYVIAGVIIDFGNILMYGILGWMCGSSTTCFQDIMNGLMQVVNDFSGKYILENSMLSGVGIEDVIGIAIATIYTFVYGFILLALAMFLLVRTAGLAILLILSPFAYFGEVMPGMEKVANKWWNNVWSYTLFGPIFVLMLYISGELARMTIVMPPIPNTDLGAYGEIMSTIITNLIPLFFLLAVVPVTKELGLAGTDTIMKNTTGLRDGIAGYASDSWGRYVARGAKDTRKGWSLGGAAGTFRRGLSNFSPTAWKRAYKSRVAEQDHDYDIATGAHWNKLNQPLGGKPQVDRKQIAIDREVTRVMSTLSDNIKALADTNKKAVNDKDAILIEASLKKLSTSGDTAVALRENGFRDTREGFSDYMQHVKQYLGKDRSEILAEEVGYAEDKDGNTGFIGFRRFEDNGDTRLLNLSDKTYRDNNGKVITAEELEKLKKDKPEKWNDNVKTDKEWQQRAINEKLEGKTVYPRNSKLKANTLFEQIEETNADGKKTGEKHYEIGEQGAAYYNTIGEGNLQYVDKSIKKEATKQRDALYRYYKEHKPNKWNTDTKGFTDMELAHLLELEAFVDEGEKRPAGLTKEYPKGIKPSKNISGTKKDKNKKESEEEEEFEEYYTPFAASSMGGEKRTGEQGQGGVIGMNQKSGQIGINAEAEKHLEELRKINPEAVHKGFPGIMRHENEHLKGLAKNAPTYSGQEMMADVQDMVKNYDGDVDKLVEDQINKRMVNDVAKFGLAGMKNIKYGFGPTDMRPPYLDHIKPELAKRIVEGMEKTRQDWESEYDKELKKDAEKGASNGGGGGASASGAAGGGSSAGRSESSGAASSSAYWSEKEAESSQKNDIFIPLNKVADSNMSKEEYKSRKDQLKRHAEELKKSAEKVKDNPNQLKAIEKGIAIVNAQESHIARKEDYRTKVNKLMQDHAKKTGKNKNEALNDITNLDEYKKLDLSDKFNDADLEIAAAKYGGDSKKIDELSHIKEKIAFDYIKNNNINDSLLNSIEKLKGKIKEKEEWINKTKKSAEKYAKEGRAEDVKFQNENIEKHQKEIEKIRNIKNIGLNAKEKELNDFIDSIIKENS